MQYNLITRQSLSQLTQWMSWANRANGVLMVLTGLFAFLGAFSGSFSSALLAMYVGGFGVLLLLYEFRSSAEMQRDFGFMYAYVGRAAFLLLIANLSWTCAPLGIYSALITNANATL